MKTLILLIWTLIFLNTYSGDIKSQVLNDVAKMIFCCQLSETKQEEIHVY